MFYVYVLKSKNEINFYAGMTTDLERRLSEHNSGKTRSTKAFKPWGIVYFEMFENRGEARKREKYFKSGSGREWVKLNLEKNMAS